MAERNPIKIDDVAAERIARVIARISADDVHRATNAVDKRLVERASRHIGLPPSMLKRDPSIDRALRRRLRRVPPAARVEVYQFLTAAVLTALRDGLGPDRFAEPSADDLEEVLPGAIERFGPRLVALCLTLVSARRFVAAPICDRLLEGDPRFGTDALGPEVVDEASAPTPSPARPAVVAEDADERRAARRARKREGRGRGRPARPDRPVRYRRAGSRVETEPTGAPETTGPTERGTVALRRRIIRIVHRYPDLRHDDALIGRIVWAVIRFGGPVSGRKLRPCVVVATSGDSHLVVRPCYSEGGRIADDFSSVSITDLDEAGLPRPTRVSVEERRIHRAGIRSKAGWMPVQDWNQL